MHNEEALELVSTEKEIEAIYAKIKRGNKQFKTCVSPPPPPPPLPPRLNFTEDGVLLRESSVSAPSDVVRKGLIQKRSHKLPVDWVFNPNDPPPTNSEKPVKFNEKKPLPMISFEKELAEMVRKRSLKLGNSQY